MGKRTPTGKIFSEADFDEWTRQGHELGCHTFDHCDAWETVPAEFEASILRNRQAAVALVTGANAPTLSYPINCPRPATKRRAGKYFTGCRGGGQTLNAGTTDLNLLKAFFLEQQRDDLPAIQRMIDETVRQRGWLILATHDVCDAPTRFGCTPAWLNQIVRAALASGAAVLPVGHALESIQGAAGRGSNADRISG
jgi:peptidoglycan/xylan/chitin deacetylase (PgdA/CDA1 family)